MWIIEYSSGYIVYMHWSEIVGQTFTCLKIKNDIFFFSMFSYFMHYTCFLREPFTFKMNYVQKPNRNGWNVRILLLHQKLPFKNAVWLKLESTLQQTVNSPVSIFFQYLIFNILLLISMEVIFTQVWKETTTEFWLGNERYHFEGFFPMMK